MSQMSIPKIKNVVELSFIINYIFLDYLRFHFRYRFISKMFSFI